MGIEYTFESGGSGSITGANDGVSVEGGNVVLGQEVAAAGDPAKLLSARQIPFAGFDLSLVKGVPADPLENILNFWDEAPVKIHAGSGVVVGDGGLFELLESSNYGTVYSSVYAPGGTMRMDRWSLGYTLGINGEGAGVGMPDATLNFGYNITAAGGRNSNQDAAWRFGFETNFLGNVDVVGLDMEFHLPEIITFAGATIRTNSYYVNKTTGYAFNQKFVDSTEWWSAHNPVFASIAFSLKDSHTPTIDLVGTGLAAFGSGFLNFTDNGTGNAIGWLRREPWLLLAINNDPRHGFGNNGDAWFNQSLTAFTSTGNTIIGMGGTQAFDTSWVEASALLQCFSTTQGFLKPRMTTAQKLAIAAPAEGLSVYDLTLHQESYFNGTVWINL